MSRIIKFRAFYKPHNKRCYEFGDGSEEKGGVNKLINKYQQDDNWVLMQFTGLLDKNDKEIYEGDILSYGYYEGHLKGKNILCLHKVYWDGEHAQFCGFEIHENSDSGFLDTFDAVVIGNIYQHKHLLEAQG